MDDKSQMFFDYLRDLLYEPGKAGRHADRLSEEDAQLAEGMRYFAYCMKEQQELAGSLAKGSLSVPAPRKDNELAAPLKRLHASLRHLTWQSQQVAKGDYTQKVDFMGEFAEAFNTMIDQLAQREQALDEEIEKGRQRNLELEQSNSLLEDLTNQIPQWIIVVDKKEKTVLFTNNSAKNALNNDSSIAVPLHEWLKSHTISHEEAIQEESLELVLTSGEHTRYFQVVTYPIRWKKRDAMAHVFTDVSNEMHQVQKLENYAYQDNLTHIYNRYYGMQVLRDWLAEHRQFSICFADLDNLKSVNDNFGHREGDRYIISAAEALSNFSHDAVVARLGGDEFMVLAPGCTQQQAEERMMEVRRNLINDNEKTSKSYCASVSFGVVEVGEGNMLSSSELLALADERMYRFKRANKANRMKAEINFPV